LTDIWYLLSDADAWLYHYTSATKLLAHILPTGRLQFSPFDAVNDPRENRQFELNALEWGDDIPFETPNAFAKSLKSGWRIACFTSDPPHAAFAAKLEATPSDFDRMHDRGHSRPRMWAQYADNHRGACIVFRKEQLGHCIRAFAAKFRLRACSGQVAYEDIAVVPRLAPGPFSASMNSVRKLGLEEAARLHSERYLAELFLTKNRDWEAEHEFRWLLHGPGADRLLVEVDTSIAGVLLGADFPETDVPAVAGQILTSNIELAKMRWKNGIPQIEPLNVPVWAGMPS